MEFLASITIGQYVPGNSFVHRLYPATKILLVLAIIIYLFAVSTYTGATSMFVLLLFTTIIARISPVFIIRGLKMLIFFIVLAMLMHILFTSEGNELFAAGPFRVTDQGLYRGGFIVYRLILLVYATSLLTLTTTPVDLTYGIERLGQPLNRIGVPVHELAMMTTIALRFIPVLLSEVDRIIKAQKSRCARFDCGSLTVRARAFMSILVPLFIGAFGRAEDLAYAMEIRCYRADGRRTRFRPILPGWVDALGVAITVLAMWLGWS